MASRGHHDKWYSRWARFLSSPAGVVIFLLALAIVIGIAAWATWGADGGAGEGAPTPGAESGEAGGDRQPR